MKEGPILLVEDDSNDVLLVKRAFKKAGIKNPLVIKVEGDSAMEYLNGEERPLLILLDLKLPKKSGLEILKWIKEQPHLQRIPVIVLTSSMERKDVNTAYDLGANSYLEKPFSLEKLDEIMNKIKSYWLDLNVYPNGA